MNVFAKYQNGKSINSAELSGLTEEELLRLKELVDEDLLHIGDQLLQVRQKAATTQTYADPDWYRRIIFAKKIKGGLSQKIQNELRKRRKARAEQPERPSEQDAFIKGLLRAMDDVLSPAEKQEIIRRAHIIQKQIITGESR